MCYNCGKMGHDTRDCLEPMKTCSYCKGQDNNVEKCPQLVTKWQARTITGPNPAQNLNPNPNPNLNIQMIATQPIDPNVVAITKGGVATGAHKENPQEQLQLQV